MEKLMNYKVVTAFNESLLQHSTFHLLTEFKENWEPSIEFHCYYYDIDLSNYSLPKASNIFYHNLLEMEEFTQFRTQFPQHNGTEGGSIQYTDILDAQKTMPKVMALTECAFNNSDSWLIWLDPLAMNTKDVSQKTLSGLFPEHSKNIDFIGFDSDSYFMAFNLSRTTPVELLGDLRGAYTSGEFLNYREWHDAFIFNRLRTIYTAHGMHVHELTKDNSYLSELFVNLSDKKNSAFRNKDGKRIFELSDTKTTGDILPNRYKQLADLIRFYKPSTILETGTWNGGRAIEMALASFKHQDSVHYIGFDLFEDATTITDHEEFNVKPHNTMEAVEKRFTEFAEHMQEKEKKTFTFELTKGDVRVTLDKFVKTEVLNEVDFALMGSGNSVETTKIEYEAFKNIPIVVADHYFTKESDEDETMPPERYHGVKNVFDSVKTQMVNKEEEDTEGWTVFEEEDGVRKYILPSQDKVAGGGHTHLVLFLHDTSLENIPKQLKSVPIIVHPRDCVPRDYINNNIKTNMTLIGPDKWVTKHEIHRQKAIMVSAGPYLDYGKLKKFIKDNPGIKVLTVKHAYPGLLKNGIKPWGCILLDPRPITGKSTHNIVRKDLFKEVDPDTTFFLASMTDPSVTNFFISKEVNLFGWHAFTDSLRAESEQGQQIQNQQVNISKDLGIPQGATMITGGTCAAMRGIGMLHTMGFRDVHLFGFDCCRDEPTKEEMSETTGDIEGGEVPKPKYIQVTVRDKEYWTTGELLAMAQDCEKVFQDEGLEGVLTFHGEDTMIADLWELQQEKKTRPEFEGFYA
tara:strand:- start:500 stop:2893 length:2394 start_codon:yes stop_codon:yes gene_type:complete